MPSSDITAIASGRTMLGFVPAREHLEPVSAKRPQEAFRHLASCGVSGAENEHPLLHDVRSSSRRGTTTSFGFSRQRRHEPAKEQRRHERAGELRGDEARGVGRADAGKRVRQRSGDGDGRIRKRRRRRKPVRAGDVETDGHRNGFGARSRAAPDDGEQSERRHELAEELRAAGANVLRELKQRSRQTSGARRARPRRRRRAARRCRAGTSRHESPP